MGFLNEIFGGTPAIPKVPPLDLSTEQGKAITTNTAALPAAEGLVGQSNQFSRDQILQMLRQVIPGYDTMASTAPANINSMLRGQIPKDVSDTVLNNAAAKSLGTGTAGSGMARNLVARDLGLTSLDLTQKGLSMAESWIKMSDAMYQPTMLNLSSMFVSPMQQAAFDVNERNLQVQQEWLQNQIEAMPDPVLGGINQEIYGLAQSFLGGVGSRVGGGGAGGSPGAPTGGAAWARQRQAALGVA